MKMFQKIALIAGCAVLLLTMLSACGKEREVSGANDTGLSPPVSESTVAESERTEHTAPGDFSVTAAEGTIVIETGYGSLFFPEQWAELLRAEREVADGYVKVTFSADVDGAVYPLFEVAVGDCGDGNHVGTLTDENGVVRDVRLRLFSLRDVTDLSEDALDRLYAMQEDVNHLIEYINHLDT